MAVRHRPNGVIKPPKGRKFKLELGCGFHKEDDGYIGIDIRKTPVVDYVLDLRKVPWPIGASAVDNIRACYLLPYFTAWERIVFMGEAYRVLKPGGELKVIVPYWSHLKAYQDPLYQWPPCTDTSFFYYAKDFREANKLWHEIDCDFAVTIAHGIAEDWVMKAQEARDFAIKNYNNVVPDLHVTLVARK